MTDVIEDSENSARLAGLLAMIALPMVRTADGRERRRTIQIEYRPGKWETIEGVEVKAQVLVFWRGRNGSSQQFSVPASRCPQWRADKAEPKFLIDDEDPRPRDAR
jgi:hypothetical protein